MSLLIAAGVVAMIVLAFAAGQTDYGLMLLFAAAIGTLLVTRA